MKKAGCKTVFKDEGLSGATTKRPALLRCLKTLQDGDTLIVRKLDRLGRSLRDLIAMLDDLKAIEASRNPMPRVMNVDKNPAYPAAVEALKAEGAIPRRVALRQCKYLNNVIEQDHRT